jgi:hypothetical protein
VTRPPPDAFPSIGVEEDDQVAGGKVEAAAHRLALAVRRLVRRRLERRRRDDRGAGVDGDEGRAVGRAVVDDEQLVDEPDALAERLADGGDDRPDRGGFVACRDADRHPQPGLGPDQRLEGEVAVVESRDQRSVHDTIIPDCGATSGRGGSRAAEAFPTAASRPAAAGALTAPPGLDKTGRIIQSG